MFEKLPDNFSYPELEKETLKFWDDNAIFEKSLEQRDERKIFSFFEGPPTVNGKPGIHHVMARAIKDSICRYKTMRGYRVRRQAGWDTHGLPVEIAVEKELGLNSKDEVIKYGIDKFNKKCKEFVYRNIEMDLGWRYLTRRMGYWIDLDKAYITCENEYVESVWWALKSFFDKGLIYKGFKVVPQSPTIETPLSSHELALPGGYKEVRDPNCFLKLKIKETDKEELKDAYFVVWTTTPWTLLANVAIAVGEDIDYVLVENVRKTKEGETADKLVLAKERLSILDGEYKILREYKGKDLLGTVYEQIFDYNKIDREKYPDALTVLPGDFVSTEDGSGIVHLAPAFGEDDYETSKRFKIPFIQPVTPNGHFDENQGEFAGRAVKTFQYPDRKEEGADKDIVIALKKAGKIYRSTNDYLHSYPHCWRTGNPVIYYARESWFIKSPEYKKEMAELNKEIRWQPPEIGAGRFGNWLEEAKEWNLSRNRFWGTPIPIWVSEDGEDAFAIGSIEELKEGYFEKENGERVKLKDSDIEIDLHRPFVDKVVFEKNGKIYRRIEEIADVWFDSGSMPFAQFHYPFENKEEFEKYFPADFIAEGVDQTRGWFYTLHNIATALFGKPAFKNIIVNELILDEKGVKMSKSKGNVVDPFIAMDKYGADAVRWYLLANNPPWKATLFNEKDMAKTVISDFLRSLTNAYSFFALYANIDGFTGEEEETPLARRPEIDRWILSRLNSVRAEYLKQMENYDITKALRAVQFFVIDDLSNWYIRRNRRRFWKGDIDEDKIAAYQTLREVLLETAKNVAPAAPFIAEVLYRKLKRAGDPESVHLAILQESDESVIDVELEKSMRKAQNIVSIARFLREKAKIRVRQPLRRILIPAANEAEKEEINRFADIVKEELNVKEIEFVAGDSEILQRFAKPNFKTIGKKFGKSTQKVAAAIRDLKDEEIKTLEKDGKLRISVGGETFEIETEDVIIGSKDIEGWLAASRDNVAVALDVHLDDNLIDEGIAREFVNRIQNLRKKSNFEVTDRINLEYQAPERVAKALRNQADYVKSETLCESFEEAANLQGEEIEFDDYKIVVKIEKAKI